MLSGKAVLLPIQQRFSNAAYKEKDHYNQSALLNISKAIKAEELRDVIQVLSNQHDVRPLQGCYTALQRS